MVAIAASCTADNKLHVKIDAKNLGDTIVVVSQEDPDARQTFTGKQGVFDFEVEVAEPTTLFLVEPQMFRGIPGVQFQIPAVPGEQATITQEAGASRYDITGSKFYAQYHQADLMIEDAQKEMNDFMQKCQAMMASGTPRDSVMKVYNEGIEPLQQNFSTKVMDYIKAHADEEASAANRTTLNLVRATSSNSGLLEDVAASLSTRRFWIGWRLSRKPRLRLPRNRPQVLRHPTSH